MVTMMALTSQTRARKAGAATEIVAKTVPQIGTITDQEAGTAMRAALKYNLTGLTIMTGTLTGVRV